MNAARVLLVLALAVPPTAAQSFNIDFEPFSNPYGPLSTYHAGAAHSPGVWNSASNTLVQDLRTLSGAATSVDLAATSGTGSFLHAVLLQTGGEIDAVQNDFFRATTDSLGYGSTEWTFTSLAPGQYDVFTISASPTLGDGLWVFVLGSPDGSRMMFADAGPYEQGGNYTLHHKTVTDGTIRVAVSNGGFAPSDPVISAIQLVRRPEPGEVMCPGDGTAAACPCANSGGTGRGCQNSASTGGAFLLASGTTTPDTIVLHSSGELPSSLTIFLQGTASISAVSFGDGLRCAGGPLLRLYVKNASEGVASAPGPADPSITMRAAALGQTIDPGDRRYYQAYYRDPNTGFCAAPIGANFNASPMLRITW